MPTTPAPSIGRSPGCSTDLKQRGLLDDTLVWWGSEFGRTPYAEKQRHRPRPQPRRLHRLAGRRRRQAAASPSAPPTSSAIRRVEDKVHMHDLHATILHLLGLDHERLTYRYSGRDYPARPTSRDGSSTRSFPEVLIGYAMTL